MKNTLAINLIPKNDPERLEALRRYRILDSPAEQAFDNLVSLACQMFNMPVGLISLIDEDRVYFKASYGGDGVVFYERENNICSFVVLDDDLVIIENAIEDKRVKTNPAVCGDTHIRFYAGAPITTKDGYTLGSICVVDTRPRSFDIHSRQLLKHLASLVIERMDFRLADIEKAERRQMIQQLNDKLSFANTQLTRTNENLREANLRLEAAQKVQSALMEQLQFSQTKLQQAIASGNMGTWSIEATTASVQLSGRGKELFGFPVTQDLTIENVLETIDPEHQLNVASTLQNALGTAQDIDISFPIIHLTSHQRSWIRMTGKVFYDNTGKPLNYSGMLMDVTEQKQMEERKNDFIGIVSHELKTPLTSISGYIELLQMSKSTDPFTAGVLGKSFKQVKKMAGMINSFLNISRLESGKLEIVKTDFVLNELIADLVDETRVIQSKHIIYFHPCEAITVHADKDKIGNVIINLLSNATKYAPTGTNIEITCQVIEHAVQVSVKDEGIGISPADQQRLFERYYRVKGDTSISGFGIGLYLSAEIINRHEGYIGVESEVGKGSTFYFRLPLQ